MQAETISARATGTRLTIDDISPHDLANSCWEAHPWMWSELGEYFTNLLAAGRGQLYGAYDARGDQVGRVAVEIHPGYASRGFPCATFGWLDGADDQVIALLLETASEWAAQQQVVRNGRPRRNALLRGPISFPKEIGGVGCQVEGIGLPRMYVISTNRPELAARVAQAGFAVDATYACVDVSGTPSWEKAASGEGDFTLGTLTEAECPGARR